MPMLPRGQRNAYAGTTVHRGTLPFGLHHLKARQRSRQRPTHLLGQGSWHPAQGRHPEAVEEEALRTGLSLGMTLVDTAEICGDGHSEEMISRVIAGQRQRVFLVSKVHANHVSEDGIVHACEPSLARLGTDYLDLYLLHWRNDRAALPTLRPLLARAGHNNEEGVSGLRVSHGRSLRRRNHASLRSVSGSGVLVWRATEGIRKAAIGPRPRRENGTLQSLAYRQLTDALRFPEFAQWCGSIRTADWHTRFGAEVAVYGHLHIPRTTHYDGVRFEEVSLGYPSEWSKRAKPPVMPKKVLSG